LHHNYASQVSETVFSCAIHHCQKESCPLKHRAAIHSHPEGPVSEISVQKGKNFFFLNNFLFFVAHRNFCSHPGKAEGGKLPAP
jgi:hypothetical protein